MILDKTNISGADFLEGMVIPVNKPREWTSFDVVNKIRNLLCKRLDIRKMKVGHAGTLDPLATGVLILCTGRMTKKIETFQNQNKEYIADITMGAHTASYDAETELEDIMDASHVSIDQIENKLYNFKGKIVQVPPRFSAVKIKGKPAYKLARKGKDIQLKGREVVIDRLEIVKYEPPTLTLKVNCSKGTYIRSLAHDLGQELGVGAYLSSLQRTAIGDLYVEQCFDLDELISLLYVERKNQHKAN